MRLLFLIDEIVIKGGTEKHLWDLAHGMSERGHQITVVSLWSGPFGKSFERSKNLNYISLGVRRIYGFKGILGFVKLISIIRFFNIEIVQTFHTAADLIGPIASFFSWRKPINISSRRDLGFTKADRHIKVQRIVSLFFVDKIICNSIEVQKQVLKKEKVNINKTKIIYNGIEVKIFTSIHKQAPTNFIGDGLLSRDGFYIGSVANLRSVKGIHVLLEAITILQLKYPNMYFLIAGDGTERKRLEELARTYKISEKLFFLGWIEDIPDFLSTLDIYIQPSLTEGFSNSILEAMAAGLPTIATRVGGNKEIINHYIDGILIEPNDSTEIAKSIEILYLSKERRIMIAEAGRNKVVSLFTLSFMLNQYEDFYRTCLNNP